MARDWGIDPLKLTAAGRRNFMATAEQYPSERRLLEHLVVLTAMSIAGNTKTPTETMNELLDPIFPGRKKSNWKKSPECGDCICAPGKCNLDFTRTGF